MNLKAFLAEQQENARTQTQEAKSGGGFERLDDGRYELMLDECELKENSKGEPMIQWTWKVIEGPSEGKKVWDFDNLVRDGAWKWLQIKLDKFGIDLDSFPLTKLQSVLDGLVDNHTTIQGVLKTKGEFQNMTVKKVYDSGEAPTGNKAKEGEEISVGMALIVKHEGEEIEVIVSQIETDKLIVKFGRKTLEIPAADIVRKA